MNLLRWWNNKHVLDLSKSSNLLLGQLIKYYKLYIMCSPTSVYLRLPQKSVLQLRTPLLWVRYYINFLQQQQYRNDNSFKTDFDGPPMSFDYFNTVPEYVYNNLQLPCLFIYQFGGKLKAPIQIFPPIYLIICASIYILIMCHKFSPVCYTVHYCSKVD